MFFVQTLKCSIVDVSNGSIEIRKSPDPEGSYYWLIYQPHNHTHTYMLVLASGTNEEMSMLAIELFNAMKKPHEQGFVIPDFTDYSERRAKEESCEESQS